MNATGMIRRCLNGCVCFSTGQQVLAFRLVDGKYQECDTSIVLPGLPIALLEEVLDRLAGGTNISAANWFMQAIAKL
jgi:hypothetical protein